MEEPRVAEKGPKMAQLEEGKTYTWCACGRSENQPWCNGSHKETGITPKVFTAEESKKAALCQCKHTKNPPFCDGSHNQL